MSSMYQVCDLVVEKFDRLGPTVTGVTCERITSAGGRHVGEAFRAGDLKAEWLFDHDVLVIHRGATVLRLIAVNQAISARARAPSAGVLAVA